MKEADGDESEEVPEDASEDEGAAADSDAPANKHVKGSVADQEIAAQDVEGSVEGSAEE